MQKISGSHYARAPQQVASTVTTCMVRRALAGRGRRIQRGTYALSARRNSAQRTSSRRLRVGSAIPPIRITITINLLRPAQRLRVLDAVDRAIDRSARQRLLHICVQKSIAIFGGRTHACWRAVDFSFAVRNRFSFDSIDVAASIEVLQKDRMLGGNTGSSISVGSLLPILF